MISKGLLWASPSITAVVAPESSLDQTPLTPNVSYVFSKTSLISATRVMGGCTSEMREYESYIQTQSFFAHLLQSYKFSPVSIII